MGSNADTDHENDQTKIIDEKTLLQVNGSMIVGALFVLTLTAFVSGSEAGGRFAVGLYTVIIITPFAISTTFIIGQKRVNLKVARFMTWAGFITFVMYVGTVIVLPVFINPTLVDDIRQQCANSPKTFNATAEPWKCSMFTPGSLAEQCVKCPKAINVTKIECIDFIPPSS